MTGLIRAIAYGGGVQLTALLALAVRRRDVGRLPVAGRALRMYDGHYLNSMYATSHSWTAFAREQADRRVVQEDQLR